MCGEGGVCGEGRSVVRGGVWGGKECVVRRGV